MFRPKKIVQYEPRTNMVDQYRVAYLFKYDGYFVYVRHSRRFERLFGWAISRAGKLPYWRINSIPIKDEHAAWDYLERHCCFEHDWHGVGYARAMRQELCRLDNMSYGDAYISHEDRGYLFKAPEWVNAVYLVPKNKVSKPPIMLSRNFMTGITIVPPLSDNDCYYLR